MARERTPEEVAGEWFPTPAWVVDRLVECLQRDTSHLSGSLALDPCVGLDALPRAWDAACGSPYVWTKVDIRDTGVSGATVANYLSWTPVVRFDLCVMNPPFSLALKFAHRACQHARTVFMLQRLDWLASEKRQPWMRDHTPSVFVIPNRIDFDGRGGDQRDYAWFGFGVDAHPTVRILDTTPADVRRAQKPGRPRERQRELASW